MIHPRFHYVSSSIIKFTRTKRRKPFMFTYYTSTWLPAFNFLAQECIYGKQLRLRFASINSKCFPQFRALGLLTEFLTLSITTEWPEF